MAFIAAHPIISALMAAGTAMEVGGQYQQAKSAKAQADYNAEVAQRQAEAMKAQGKIEQYQIERRKRLALGKQRSLYAKAGLDLSGTPLEVLADTAAQYDLDLATSRYNTNIGVSNYGYESRYNRYAGNQAMKAGYLKMGGTLLTAAGQSFNTSPKMYNNMHGFSYYQKRGLASTPPGGSARFYQP